MQSLPYKRISLVYFTYFSVVGILTPYWSLYLDYLAFSPSAIGMIIAIPMITKVLAPNIWGWLADRSGRRLLVARLGAAGSLLFFSGLLFQQPLWMFVFLIAAFSFFWNAIHAQFEVVTLNYLKDKPESYSHVRVWGSVGFILVVLVLGFVLDRVSAASIPWFIWVFLLGIMLSSLTLPKQDQSPSHKAMGNFLGILKNRRILLFFLLLFLIQFSLGIYHAFFSLYMEGYGYSKTSIGLFWSLGVLAEIILFLFVPRLLKNYSLNTLIALTLVLSFIRWIITAFFADVLLLILLAQCLHAFTFGMTHAVAIEFVRREFGEGQQSQGQAFYNAVGFGAANAFGSIVGGYLFEVPLLAMPGQFAFCASIAIVCLAAILFMQMRRGFSRE